MKITNKKGFTLVELLAVLVILIVVVLIAVNVVNSRVKKAKKNSVEVNANNYIRAVNGVAALSQNIGEDMEKGTYQVRDLNKTDIKISGEKPRRGFLLLDNYEVTTGCLMYENYSAIITNGKTSSITKTNCDKFVLSQEFDYSGSESTFNVSVTGTYLLEVWGAQGGSYDETHFGGSGSYSSANIHLSKGDTLYINVGGKGEDGVSAGLWQGGYNGGGNGKMTPRNDCFNSGGGGATSIATKSGLLAIFTSAADKNKIIIVAGGGGGSGYYNNNDYGNGGSAGGASGETGGHVSQAGRRGGPGAQLTGYSVGKGEDGSTKGDGGAGGGGGYFGGYASNTNGGGGGGSGYIDNELLTNKVMYCNNCTESSEPSSKTIITTCAEDNPTKNCAKKGNGYARITFVN